jgi:hypothetical protein
MLVTRALDKDDQKLLALMTKRVGVALRLQRCCTLDERAGTIHAFGDCSLESYQCLREAPDSNAKRLVNASTIM